MRLIFLLLFLVCAFTTLLGQTTGDQPFLESSFHDTGVIDISNLLNTEISTEIRLFHPNGIKKAIVVSDSFEGVDPSYKNFVADKIDLYRAEIDTMGRLISSTEITGMGYDAGNGWSVGYHTKEILHKYYPSNKEEISFINTRKNEKIVWQLEEGVPLKCQKFSGKKAELFSTWIWEYLNDTLDHKMTKFNENQQIEYQQSYNYDDDLQLNHVFVTLPNNDLAVSIHEVAEDGKKYSIAHYDNLKDVFDDCYIRDNELFKLKSDCIKKRKSKAKTEEWEYDNDKQLISYRTYFKRSSKEEVWKYEYDLKGRIKRKIYSHYMLDDEIVEYNYDQYGKISSIEYFTDSGEKLERSAFFDYNSRGDVKRWHVVDGNGKGKEEFVLEYEYYR